MRRALLGGVAALVLGLPIHAVDGVLEINQACAVGNGCFPGDTAGYPVEIGASGSYRLTGNLSVGDDAVDGIAIGAPNVTLDLNGFEVAGPASGSGRGIGVDAEHATVRDGTVRDFGQEGIGGLGRGARVEDVRVVSNGFHGIGLGAGAQVRRCYARSNGGHGVSVGDIGVGSIDSVTLVEGCVIRDSTGHGLRLINGDALRNRIDNNRQIGIVADGICLVAENHVEGNGPTLGLPFAGGVANGTSLSQDHIRIVDNLISRNGEDNVRIESSGNVIERNTIRGFGFSKYGLRITASGNVYSDNRFTDHATADTAIAGGNVDGGGNLSH